MKRLTSLLLAVVVLASLVVACAPAPTPTPKPAPPTPAPPEAVTLTFTHPTWFGDYSRYRERYIVGFEKMMAARGTPVEIEIIEYPSPDDPYRGKLVLDLAAGQAPDIYLADTFWIGEFVEAEYLLDLTDRANAWEDWDQWEESAKGAVTFQGKVWGLNRDTDARPLYYRTDIFEQAGLPVPWEPKSWDDLLAAARTIKEQVPEVTPIALKSGIIGGEGTTMQGFYMALLGAGGRLYNAETGKWIVKSPALLDTLRFYATLYDEELTVEPEFWLAGDPMTKIHNMLGPAGTLAIFATWNGVWYDMDNPDHERFIPPQGTRDSVAAYTAFPAKAPGAGIRGQDAVTISGGWADAINARTEHPELAWEFLKFMHSADEQLAHLLDTGSLPIRKDVAAEWKLQADDYQRFQLEELVPITTFRPPLPIYPRVSVAVQEATENILLEMTPEEALERYAETVTRIVGADNVEEQ